MKFAKRVESLPPYLFAEISKKIAAKRAEGHDVVTFAIGDPDLPTPPNILAELHRASDDPANHRYPESEGLPELGKAIADWYERRFEVKFQPMKETLPLIGSKEGIAHVALCFIDPGDIALMPDPGYPVYEIGTMFAGGTSYKLDCTRESGWKPNLDAIPADVAEKAKVLWLNYPNNPTGAIADLAFFEKAVAFAKKYDVAILHDNPYCDVAFDGYKLDCTRESGWKPNLDAIPADVAEKAKVLWLNYPNNPTGAGADLAFFEKAVAFAKKYDVAILHDNPYCDVAFDGYKPVSIFQVPGARDVAIEFNSWSKIYNMTGWRIGMVVGNQQMIDALMRVKSNIDSGIPQAVQRMAIEAVYGPQDCIDEHNAIYQRRRDRIVAGLRKIGLEVEVPKASLYVWAKLPDGVKSADFASRLIEDTSVVVTPGRGYGLNGEGYIRLSVTTPDERVEEGMRRVEAWKGM